jgi:predicted O-methyltransferase YrrM
MNFIDSKIEEYANAHTSPESELLNKIQRETNLEVLRPRMLCGHFQGRLLSMLSHMIKPVRILEIGTYTGYSALCLVEGLKEDGLLITVDINEELEDRVRGYFSESPFDQKIEYMVGNALTIIPKLTDKWDMVFIDADKTNYLEYFKLIIPNVRSGAYIIADNVLWSGKVINSEVSDEDTDALRIFNKIVSSNEDFEVVLLPVRDGLMIVRKK